MSKYDPLWHYVSSSGSSSLLLTYDEIQSILGFSVDHSFLSFKKELTQHGYSVEKISMKDKTISFIKSNP